MNILRLSATALLLTAVSFAQLAWEQKASADIADALKKTGAPSLSVVIIEDAKVAFAHAFGKADLASGRNAEPDTRYAVGSISKQFTVAALLLLQEQGKLTLDDKVARFFPELTQANQISIRQLLSHTAGYEDFAPQDYLIPEWTHPTTPAAILGTWARKPLNFDPGTCWPGRSWRRSRESRWSSFCARRFSIRSGCRRRATATIGCQRTRLPTRGSHWVLHARWRARRVAGTTARVSCA